MAILSILLLSVAVSAALTFEEQAAAQDQAVYKDGLEAVLKIAEKRYEDDDSVINGLLLARLLPPKAAVKILESAVRDHPDDIQLRLQMGDAYLAIGKGRAADKEGRRVVDLAPEDPRGHHLMGRVSEANNKLKIAERFYEAALEKAPNRPQTLVALALLLHQMERSDEAVARLEKAGGGKDPIPEIMLGLGELRLLRREYKEAIEALTKVMKSDELRPVALARRGYASLKLEDFERATRDLNQAIRMRPNFYLPRVHLGVALEWQAKLEEARNTYTAARDKAPDRPEAICRLGYLDWIEGDLKSAEKAERLAIKKDKKYILAHLYLAQILVQGGDLNAGRKSFQAALKIDKQCFQAYLELARLYIQQGKLPDALKSIKKAIDIRPEEVEAIAVKGLVYLEMKKYAEARSTLVIALDLNPEHASAYRTLGRLEEAQEHGDEAVIQYERAVEFDKGDAFARYLLGMLLFEQGNDQAALEHLVAYLDLVGEDKGVEGIVSQLEG